MPPVCAILLGGVNSLYDLRQILILLKDKQIKYISNAYTIFENAQKGVSRHYKKVVFSEAEHMNVWGSLRKTSLFALLNGYNTDL